MSRRNIVFLVAPVLLGAATLAMLFARHSFVRQPSATPPFLQATSATSAGPIGATQRAWPTPFSVDLRALPPKDDLPPGTLRILVVGDSVAKFLGLAMRYRQDEKQTFVADRGVGNCSIFESKPYIENGKPVMSSSCSMSWATDAAELRPDVTLIMMGGGFFNEGACTQKFQTEYEKRIFDMTAAMGTNAGQIVMTRVPYPIKSWRHSNVMERVDCFNEMLVRSAKKRNYEVLDLMQHVCPTRDCNVESEGKPIRPDGLHFDGGGTEETARWVLDELKRMHPNMKSE